MEISRGPPKGTKKPQNPSKSLWQRFQVCTINLNFHFWQHDFLLRMYSFCIHGKPRDTCTHVLQLRSCHEGNNMSHRRRPFLFSKSLLRSCMSPTPNARTLIFEVHHPVRCAGPHGESVRPGDLPVVPDESSSEELRSASEPSMAWDQEAAS